MVARLLAILLATGCEDTSPPSSTSPIDALPDALPPALEAEGVLFFGGHGAPPAFVQNHNAAAADVPFSLKSTGAFVLYVAPLSDALVPGVIHVFVSLFDAAGTRQITYREIHYVVNIVTFDASGWSSSDLDYVMLGGCFAGNFWNLESGGPFIIRMDAVDEAQTRVHAEVLVQPSCALANGSAVPEPTQTYPEQCLEHCPGF